MTSRNEPCWCGSGKKWKKCHFPVSAPHDVASQYLKQYGIRVKTPEQIAGIRKSCRTAKEILEKVCARAKAGVTTDELNTYAEELYREAGTIAAPYHYGKPPYPKSICTSLNEVICHGIPDNTVLKEGDILNIDVTTILEGYYGDCSRMVMVGQVSAEKRRVVEVAYECLEKSCAILKPGLLVSAIGDVIEEIATRQGCSVVHQFVGHGVGLDFHEPPQVPHNRNNLEIPLVAGMTFTIEPMINAGVAEGIVDPIDKWTARTKDGRPSAQWEHTILITPTGHEILTA